MTTQTTTETTHTSIAIKKKVWYEIIEAYTTPTLAFAVQKKLDGGASLVGGPFSFHHERDMAKYGQAVSFATYEEPKNESY